MEANQKTDNDTPMPSAAKGNSAEMQEDNIEDSRRKEMLEELHKTEEEMATLRQVLHAKEEYAAHLKNQLGLTTLSQIKAELNKVQSSQAYKKTSETLKTAGQATATAFSTLGSTVSTKFSEMKNSPTFKSFEEKVEGVGTTIMSKVSSSTKDGDSDDVPADTGAPESPVTKQPHAADRLA